MKAGPYIESARALATFLFVVLYFGFTQSNSYATSLEQTMQARKAAAEELTVQWLVRCEEFKTWRADQPGNELDRDSLFQWLKTTPCRLPYASVPWAEDIKITPMRTIPGNLFGVPRGIVFQVEVSEYVDSRKWVATTTVDESKFLAASPVDSPIIAVARRSGFKVETTEDSLTLFSRFENELLAKEVALPGSGFSFPVGRVVWVCFLVSFGILILLRDRIEKVFLDPELGHGEPWLILDARAWAPSRLAGVWMLSLFLGPWLLALATLRMTALYFHAQARVNSSVLNVAVFTGLFAVAIGGAWTSLRIISDLLRLRRLQRHPENNSLDDPES